MQQNTTYILLLMSLPTSSLVYPASSVIASLSRELVNVGNSVQFSTGPDEVRPCLYKCSMSCVKLPGQLLLFAAFRVYMTYVNCIAAVIPTMQVYFGVLAACFNVQGEGISYCVIQLFESVDTFGTQVINEYDCPLLSLTCLFRCVSPHSIIQSVSIVHECTPTCIVKHVTPLVRWKDYQ